MPFDQLASHNLQIPEFRPAIVTQLPKPSIWPGIAQGVAGLTGVLAKALDPVEKAKRQLSLAQLSFQTKALQDLKSGKLSAEDFDPNTGLPLTEMQKLQRDHMKLTMESQRKSLEWQDRVRNSSWGDVYKLPPPSGAGDLAPVEPDVLPGNDQPERYR